MTRYTNSAELNNSITCFYMKMCCKSHLDELYYSNNIRDIVNFYDCFDNMEDLIGWMQSRPSADIKVHELNGNHEIIFVIPTPDIYNKETYDIISQLGNYYHVVLVESKGKYFNYAKSVNKGVLEALKYNPKWIIISNNDITFKEPIKVLAERLLSIDDTRVDAVIGIGGSKMYNLCRFNFLSNFAIFYGSYKEKIRIIRKYNIKFYYFPDISFKLNLICKSIVSLKNLSFIGEFLIISSNYILNKRKGVLFDTTYINGVEDVDLLLDILLNKSYTTVKYRLSHYIGKSLGNDEIRILKNYVNIVYFNYKILKSKKYLAFLNTPLHLTF